jgi:cyclopropane fatty-acyl-phospholipid synthase-like methyltransferase
MKPINQYYARQLTPEEIATGAHRDFVGGLWDEIGTLQFDFLRAQGLAPNHKLLDIGCGALRCGLPLIQYLDEGNYYGLDINASLIEAGQQELNRAGLTDRRAHLLVNDKFEFSRFGASFDFAIAQSVFTHLDMNLIVRCLVEVAKVLKPGGQLFGTFFLAPSPAHIAPIKHEPGGIVTNFDADPFHYSFRELEWLASISGFSARLIGDWGHPRGQKMLALSML